MLVVTINVASYKYWRYSGFNNDDLDLDIYKQI